MSDADKSFIIRVVTITLAIVVLSVVFILLKGLFDPVIDNKDIFAILGPAFQTVIGCFVGLAGGWMLRVTSGQPAANENLPVPEPIPPPAPPEEAKAA